MRAAMGGSVPGGACSLCDMHEAARRPWAVVLSSDLVGLGAVRSLHAGGVPTIVVMLDPLEPARASRYGHKILVPKSHDVEGALLDALAEVNREPRPVLIPTSDHLVHFMAKHRAHLEVHRSEEHTSELQSQSNLVCRLLLEKKKKKQTLSK